MVNQQDPLLNFPASTSFTPYAFFRNASATPKTLHFGLYYMEGRTVKSLPLPDLALQPGEARELPIGDLMRKQPQIQDINLSFSWDGYWGDILAGVGSIDQTGSYVFPVPPEAVYKGGARGSAYWLAEGGFDTMYTLWNPEQDAQDFLLTLKYGANGETYRLPVTLEGHASAMIDIGELIRTRQLDQDGKVLPPDVKQGSLALSGPANDLEDAIDVVLTGGIYNPTKATCGWTCQFCAGWTATTFSPTTFSLPVGAQQSFTLGWVDNYNSTSDDTPWADWTSSDSSIVAMNSGPGWAQGMAAGTATVTGSYHPVPYYHGWCCSSGGYITCPTMGIFGNAAGTVTCPSNVSVSVREPLALAPGYSNNFPTWLSGFGIETVMALGSSILEDWTGLQLVEQVSVQSNTCPGSIAGCNATGGFQVGVNQGGQTTFGYTIPTIADTRSFYDEHVIFSHGDLLAGQLVGYSCQVVCMQTYACADGTVIGSPFTVTKTLTHDTINGTFVTQVSVTKQ